MTHDELDQYVMEIFGAPIKGDSPQSAQDAPFFSTPVEPLLELRAAVTSLANQTALISNLLTLPRPLSPELGDLFYKTVAAHGATFAQVKSLLKVTKLT